MRLADDFMKTRSQFLDHCRGLAKYWAELPNKTPEERCSGVAFSILVALDGEAIAVGPFSVRPIVAGEEGENIAGAMHDLFFTKLAHAKI